MYIKSVTLKNFKKFRDKTIKFNPGMTLLVGANNEGKSTMLHALAVWEFCKNFLLINKGIKALQQDNHIAGVGMNIDDFTPINIPELKYLWTNLKPAGGYNLSIKCEWDIGNKNKFLGIGLALANDRLFVKTISSNIDVNEEGIIPKIAYLPPFAGIVDKEIWHYPAQRHKLLGQGLAGSVLRNTIVDMYNTNKNKRKELKGTKSKIKTSDLKKLRESDPYELLNNVLYKTFHCQLQSQEFNHDFHQYLHVNIIKGEKAGEKFKTFPNFRARDIMTEGSGFLQWLSVYTFALDPKIDILLLDEPDAHLHSSLQTTLFSNLIEIIHQNNHQILLATHSTEIIKSAPIHVIMNMNKNNCKYISSPQDIIKIMTGLGVEYNPIVESIVKTKRILFVENESDAYILKLFAAVLGYTWPTKLTVWATATKHDYRNHVIDILKNQIGEVAMISLIDRDTSEYKTTNNDLKDLSFTDKYVDRTDGRFCYARFRKWRRSEIENYMLNKNVLARLAKVSVSDIDEFFREKSIILPDNENFVVSERDNYPSPIFDLSGKEYINMYCNNYGVKKEDIVSSFNKDEVCNDIKTFLKELIEFCES